jgi:hypothetical protein
MIQPEFFDALVLIIIAIGVVLAALRIRSDFRSGPRFPDTPTPATSTVKAAKRKSAKK